MARYKALRNYFAGFGAAISIFPSKAPDLFESHAAWLKAWEKIGDADLAAWASARNEFFHECKSRGLLPSCRIRTDYFLPTDSEAICSDWQAVMQQVNISTDEFRRHRVRSEQACVEKQ